MEASCTSRVALTGSSTYRKFCEVSTDTPAVLRYTCCALKGGRVVALLWRYILR